MNVFLVRTFVLVSVLFFSSPAPAYLDGRLYFVNMAPFPIGCTVFVVTEPDNFHTQAKTEVVYSETIPLWDIAEKVQLDVEMRILRVGCTEPDRSILLVRLAVPYVDDDIESWVPVPFVVAERPAGLYPMRLAREANTTWRINEVLAEGETQGFYLDNALNAWLAPPEVGNYEGFMFPRYYNDEFTLHVIDRTERHGEVEGFSFVIPAYANHLKEDSLLWHGMLSGVWIINDRPDQGFMISINERPTSGGTLNLFLTWSTFDSDGNQLWLAATGPLHVHSGWVTNDLIRVLNGQFTGPLPRQRMVAGSISLFPKSCTEILAEYDLEAIGLGTGKLTLNRFEGLEMSGYACQDFETRQIYEWSQQTD